MADKWEHSCSDGSIEITIIRTGASPPVLPRQIPFPAGFLKWSTITAAANQGRISAQGIAEVRQMNWFYGIRYRPLSGNATTDEIHGKLNIKVVRRD